jgi:hypothetical protein
MECGKRGGGTGRATLSRSWIACEQTSLLASSIFPSYLSASRADDRKMEPRAHFIVDGVDGLRLGIT